ncbi:hypothetical protein MBLNU230_g2900t1 [Neophaeotheca triangularis]
MRTPDRIPDSLEEFRLMFAPSRDGMSSEAVAREIYAKFDLLIQICKRAEINQEMQMPTNQAFTTSPPAKSCSSCGSEAHLVCRACVEGQISNGELTPLTYYCNKKCQKAHRKSHKPYCDTVIRIRGVHQAGELLKQVYALWKIYALSCAENHDHYVIAYWTDLVSHDRSVEAKDSATWIQNKRRDKLPESISDRTTLLMAANGDDLVSFMADFVGKLLKPYCMDMYEVCITVDNTDLGVVPSKFENGKMVDKQKAHWVFKVFVKGERDNHSIPFAIDLNGAQYFQHKPGMLWDTYEQMLPGKIASIKQFGSMRTRFETLFQEAEDSDSDEAPVKLELEGLEECRHGCRICQRIEPHIVKHPAEGDEVDGFVLTGVDDQVILEAKVKMARALTGVTWRNEHKQRISDVVGEGTREFQKAKPSMMGHLKALLEITCKKAEAEAHMG